MKTEKESKVLTQIRNGIGYATVNREEVRNAMDAETWGLLKAAVEDMEADPAVRVIVITGAGEMAFIAGADLNALKERSVPETLDSFNNKVTRTIEECAKPTIAAVNGYCLGGGLEVALACDLRIAAENAKFGQTEINVGIIPGAGGTQRLRNLIGMGKAMEMTLTGAIISSSEAMEIGLVNRVTAKEELMGEVEKLALQIAEKSPLAVKLVKRALRKGENETMETGLLLEILCQSVLFGTRDHLEGINAFLEKRKPEYKGE